ncbi:hypothetical protein [Planctobacterium marinum]|uniref:Lipoprotein n=1 Tax=Planctobacterium marinum TaxID=1631968 RepID=A0AA48HYX9_9ALTE|nr:hypothetical protein MACH26_39190 [Planctobacterium marinum]
MKKVFILALTAALAACSSTQEVSSSDADAKDDIGYECKMVRRTGSNVPEKVCTTRQQREDTEKKSKDWMQKRAHHGNAAGKNVRSSGDGK